MEGVGRAEGRRGVLIGGVGCRRVVPARRARRIPKSRAGSATLSLTPFQTSARADPHLDSRQLQLKRDEPLPSGIWHTASGLDPVIHDPVRNRVAV